MDDEVRAALEMCRDEEGCIELFRLLLRKGLTPGEVGTKMFRIRDSEGKFSVGGGWPHFTKKGKTWVASSPGAVVGSGARSTMTAWWSSTA